VEVPSFRARQILEWVYRKHVADPRQMTNLSKADRDLLWQNMRWITGRTIRHQKATDGVQKLLLDWSPLPADAPAAIPGLNILGQDMGSTETQTECVMIPAISGGLARQREREWNDGDDVDDHSPRSRRTACISSQIGCPVGCKFCASGLSGLDGNLTTGQIVEQVWQLGALPGVIDADTSPTARPITNVVFMGMGEPLANFERVTKAAQFLSADWGLGISARRITISTVGVPAQIRRLADLQLSITLAISLHAPNDEVRKKLIPWAERVTVAQLLDAARYYFQKTGREVTLEYILLRGVNDLPQHARELASIARSLRCNVNLIRYNEVKGMPFDRPTTDDVHQFQAILRQAGINAHIRASRGRDIAAACGQLRHEHASV
jgi:23S rRNA (adenine2503-C2)-methyltransferase